MNKGVKEKKQRMKKRMKKKGRKEQTNKHMKEGGTEE